MAQHLAKYAANETAASLFREKRAAVFVWHTLSPSSQGAVTHKLRFGLPFEIHAQPRDVCEATIELIRQFGNAFTNKAIIFHISINMSLFSSLRVFPCGSMDPFPHLKQHEALKDIAVGSTTQLLALCEFLRLCLHQDRYSRYQQHDQGLPEGFKALIIFSGLNPLLSGQPQNTQEQIVGSLTELSEHNDILMAWISASPCDPLLCKIFGDRTSYVSSTNAYI